MIAGSITDIRHKLKEIESKIDRPTKSQTLKQSPSMINETYVGNKSASRIQKHWKGYLIRKKFRLAENAQLTVPTIRPPSIQLVPVNHDLEVIFEHSKENQKEDVIKIQRAVRGYFVRCTVYHGNLAASKIQSFWKGVRTRRIFQ